MADLLEPQEIMLEGTAYTISKFPAIAGREIIAKYPISSMPKLGDYAVNEETMLKLMSYVEVTKEGNKFRLSSRAMIDNHVSSWEILMKLEWKMLEYNCSFFQNGRISNFFEATAQKLPAFATKILTQLSAQWSPKEKPPSTSSEQSTP